jgi:RNA polymerase sigma-70 factor (ECF subfamily)
MYVLQDRAAAEDTLVDVYRKVADHAGSSRPEQNPVPWLIGLARQMALARLERDRRSGRTVHRPPLPVASGASVVSFEPLDPERRQVRRALAQLTPQERSIIQMTYFEGRSAREVAHELRVPTTQVTRDIQQAMWKLRTSLGEVETD